MKKMGRRGSLTKYKHDRGSHYKKTADDIFNLINNYADRKELAGLYSYFEKKYQLPECVVKQRIKQYIARSYLFKSEKFKSRLSLRSIPKSILQYGSLIYALLFIKKKSEVRNFKLIIDNICAPIELKRFQKLLNLFEKDEVLCITKDSHIKEDFQEFCVYNKKIFRDLNLKDVLKSIVNEFSVGIWIVLVASMKTRVNLFPVSLRIIHSCLSFNSLFESNKSQYIIQERHYDTDSVKNYLFKKLGGIASTSIQKNIFQIDPIFFYIDIDVLFTLGTDGYDRAIEYGGRIDCVEPMGSLFMEYYWFNKRHNYKKKYDIVILGINTSNAYERLDSYNEFMSDYYSLYHWAAKLSIDNPEYDIVLIHHSSAGEDRIEDSILSGSNVKVLDKNNNSYETAFSSRCAITYGSTMGYELNAHNIPTLFIDPGYRCSFLPEKGRDYVDKMRVNTYNDLHLLTNEIIAGNNDQSITQVNSDMWCLESSEVSNKIYGYFINYGKFNQ
jgi:hypothetical protein